MENDRERKIMVVDDDRGILKAFEVLLGDNYSLIIADNGYKAMDILDREAPPLIFLDIHMPGIDGRAILAVLKDKGVSSRVVVVTGSSDDIEEEVKTLGAYRFIKKPFEIEEIENMAKGVFEY